MGIKELPPPYSTALKKLKDYPEKCKEFPGLSPRNLFKIPEGSVELKAKTQIFIRRR
jgi:hypothetical protein